MAQPAKRLDQLLLERGLINPEQLEAAREQAGGPRGQSLGRVLIDLGYVSEASLVSILAEQLGLEFVELSEMQIDTSAMAQVSGATARRHLCIPIAFDPDGRLVLATADPANVVPVY